MENNKTVKINYCGFWSSFNKIDNLFYNVLSKRYNVEISDNPDYLFVSPLGKAYEFMDYDCIRIFYAGEEIVPDFNLFDYAIGFDDITFGDRYFRYPLCFFGNNTFWKWDEISKEQARELLKKKDIFCNFIYNEDSIGGYRKELFEGLNKYKRVDSYGRYLNNVNGNGVSYSQKHEILRRSKFTIAVEGCDYTGVATEKITQPFEDHSIPIYFGNKAITKDFNEKAMVNCHALPNIESVVERIIELDQNDDLYLEMLSSHPIIYDNYSKELFSRFERFLFNIFDQELGLCRRTVDSNMSRIYFNNINMSRKRMNSRIAQKILGITKGKKN